MFGASAILCLGVGCNGKPSPSAKKKKRPGPIIVVEDGESAAPAPKAPPKPKKVIGRKTREILDLAKIREPYTLIKPTAGGADAILLDSRAYFGPTGKLAQLSVAYCLKLYHAQHGRYPRTVQEFIDKVAKPNKLRFAARPHYQAYAYDAPKHRLVIVEFPERKKY
jgi:hypothetical protein